MKTKDLLIVFCCATLLLYCACGMSRNKNIITTGLDDRIRIVRAAVQENTIIQHIMQSQPEPLRELGLYVGAEPPDSVKIGLGQKKHLKWENKRVVDVVTIDGTSVSVNEINAIVTIVCDEAYQAGFRGHIYVVQVDSAGNAPVVMKRSIKKCR